MNTVERTLWPRLDIGHQLVQQIALIGDPGGAEIPEMMMRVADRDLRLERRLLGQRQPVVSPIRHCAAPSDFLAEPQHIA